MDKKNKIGIFLLIAIDVVFLAIAIFFIAHPSLHFGNFQVLNPKGIIAVKERGLLITVVLLMLVAVIPTFIFAAFVIWKYRAGNTRAKYSPDMQSNIGIGSLLWAIPGVIIFIVAILNWKSTHDLDPYKTIPSSVKPITIQVVALQWKWLFIYPEQNIATVNYIEFPVGSSVNFELTADAPMNSFWIPQLGGQMYAMAGMETHLHLLANEPGEYNGSAAEISGAGFAGMRFIVKSTSQDDFDTWVKEVKSSQNNLDLSTYNKLSQPSENTPKTLYSEVDRNLYNSVMMKFMMPAASTSSSMAMPGMDMENMK